VRRRQVPRTSGCLGVLKKRKKLSLYGYRAETKNGAGRGGGRENSSRLRNTNK